MAALQFSEPSNFAVNAEISSSTWVTFENRIFQLEGELCSSIRQKLLELREGKDGAARIEKPLAMRSESPYPTAVFFNKQLLTPESGGKKRNEAQFRFVDAVMSILTDENKLNWSMTLVSTLENSDFFAQVKHTAAQQRVVISKGGPEAAWLLFAAPRSTWLMLYPFREGYDLPVIRNHLRSWLVHRQCRLVVAMYWSTPTSLLEQLEFELTHRPYENEISVVSNNKVVRCNSVLTCGNLLDHTLLVEHRAMYEHGGLP
jgi:hypothetical protein